MKLKLQTKSLHNYTETKWKKLWGYSNEGEIKGKATWLQKCHSTCLTLHIQHTIEIQSNRTGVCVDLHKIFMRKVPDEGEAEQHM